MNRLAPPATSPRRVQNCLRRTMLLVFSGSQHATVAAMARRRTIRSGLSFITVLFNSVVAFVVRRTVRQNLDELFDLGASDRPACR
jgi:hypothetical protein